MQWIQDLDDLGYLDATVKFSALWDGLEKYAQQLFSVAKSEFIDYSTCTPLPGLELAVL